VKPKSEDLTYLFGGEIDAGEFSLDIWSDDLSPAEITALLGIQPTSHYLRGDSFGNGGLKRNCGSWTYKTKRLDFRSGKCCEEQFDDFMRNLTGDDAVWARISAQHQARILIVLWMRTWNREFDNSAYALGELARRRLRLHIDTYIESPEEKNETE
jgi:hypothetical protein